jgi:hypothetical protein
VVDYYDFHDVRAFLVTLRQTDFAGHVCLFAGPAIKARTERKMRECGAEVVRYCREYPFVRDPHPDLPAIRFNAGDICNYRNFLYLDYLLKHGDGFTNVLITDVRDVVFQRNPFDFPVGEQIHVAMENPLIPIGACPWTSAWVRDSYGPEVLERLKQKELSCAGTVLGPVGLMKRYLRRLLDEFATMPNAHAHADQPAHNVLVHGGALEPLAKHRNFEGPMLTVGSEPRYRSNAEGQLVNRDGSVIAIVHQYDRHPELRRLFARKVLPSAGSRVSLDALHRWKGRARRLKARLRGVR